MPCTGESLRSVFPRGSTILVPYYHGGVRLACGVGFLRRYGSEANRDVCVTLPHIKLGFQHND